MSGLRTAHSVIRLSRCSRRSEGILLLCGGLTIHNLRDQTCFHETGSADVYKQFDGAVTQAVRVRDVSDLF